MPHDLQGTTEEHVMMTTNICKVNNDTCVATPI